MLAIIRALKNLRNREHYLRTRYHRNHPHFLLYLTLDAVVTIALVGGGLAFASSHGVSSRNSAVLADLGATQMTAGQLQSQARSHDSLMYWVGPIVGAAYASEVLSPTSVTVNYLTANSHAVALLDPFLSVETYSDPRDYSLTATGPLHSLKDISVVNSHGDAVTYNSTELREAVVRIRGGAAHLLGMSASKRYHAYCRVSERIP